MPQFTVHRNPNPGSKAAYPLLLDIQSDLLADLGTRVVVPLCRISAMQGKSITTLTPVLEIEGEPYIMLTPQLAGVSRKQIGAAVADLRESRNEIIAALDLLITGI
jgi:toxin CcdB